MEKAWDVLIVGAGTAGLAAALYSSRAKLRTLVVGFPMKSNIAKAPKVFNYPGFPEGVSGKDLQKKFLKQAKKYGAKILEDEVVDIRKGKLFSVKAGKGSAFKSRSVIIATGKAYARAGICGEEKFSGKGIHYCVVCDGYAYKGRKVAVVGSGNYAAQEALELLAYTKKVSLLFNGQKNEISPQLGKELRKRKIKLVKGRILEFRGKKFLEKVVFENNEEILEGAFVAIGKASATSFANKLAVEMDGSSIRVGRDGKTSVKGVFAAGDCCGGSPQAVKSAGEGCNAALSAVMFLRGGVHIDYKEK